MFFWKTACNYFDFLKCLFGIHTAEFQFFLVFEFTFDDVIFNQSTCGLDRDPVLMNEGLTLSLRGVSDVGGNPGFGVWIFPESFDRYGGCDTEV